MLTDTHQHAERRSHAVATQTDPTREQILSMLAAHLSGPRPLTARLSREAGIASLVIGMIPAVIAGVILYNTRKLDGMLGLIVLGLGLWAAINFIWGLWYVCDRSPRLILDENGLTDFTSGLKRVIPWSAVARANLYRTTRNGSEESATLTLYLNSRILRDSEVTISVNNLDHSSQEILRVVGRWANLS
jgi:hypothetical protein